MTQAFRIGFAPAPTLEAQSIGSTLAQGRWHTVGVGVPRRVVYAASSRALAQLEKRVHANRHQPVDQALFRVGLPPDIVIGHAVDEGLPSNWRDDETATQALGDAWLDAVRGLALWVPSYVEPLENNLLINPRHPRAVEVRFIVERDPFVFDPRLV